MSDFKKNIILNLNTNEYNKFLENKTIIDWEKADFQRYHMRECNKFNPYIRFPSDLFIQIIPNNYADIRFIVTNEKNEKDVSVYYDRHGRLGGQCDYWEAYLDECERFDNNEKGITNMFNAIRKYLND